MIFALEPLGRFVYDCDPRAPRMNGGEPSWVGRLALALGVNRGEVHRWMRNGVTTVTADKLAVRLGLHPALVWPEWADSALDEPPCLWCGQLTIGTIFCSAEHGELARAERLWMAKRAVKWWARLDRLRDTIVIEMEEAA
jgi:hypothetical protein